MTTHNKQESALVTVAVTVGLPAVIGATLIGVLWALPDSSNAGTTITIILGFFGSIVPAVLNAVLGGRANRKLDRVLNGEMDAKIEAAVHRVLDERESA